MADANTRVVAKVLLLSAVLFGLLAVLGWTGALPIGQEVRSVFALSFAICAAADVLIGLVLWLRSQNT